MILTWILDRRGVKVVECVSWLLVRSTGGTV